MKPTSVQIGIYAGSGTSHSWLWFVDLFEKAGVYDLLFLDEFDVQNNRIRHLDVLVISGGDTFAVAEHLGEDGARNIERFVKCGGLYIGSCAGAYLPMKSRKAHLNRFNFVDVKITNLSKILPKAEIESCKYCTTYGCDFIFHPVRDAVTISATGNPETNPLSAFDAPLYGGPGMTAKDPSWIEMAYEGFTPKTVFLTSRQIAADTLIGKGAVVRVPFFEGCFYLLGPHLEHPGYESANQFIIDAVNRETRSKCARTIRFSGEDQEGSLETLTGKEAKKLLLSIKRELSNSRITATGLEFLPIQWLIGKKTYEPQKIRVYLESMWKRMKVLEKNKRLVLTTGLSDRIVATAIRTTTELRKIKKQVDAKQDSLGTAVIIFDLLHTLAVLFFELYFMSLFHRKSVNQREVEKAIGC